MDGLEEERRLMYVACTRAMDMLFLTESEGYNVQNSQGKYPSRFIREASDEMGALYDTVGRFDPSLWNGTDALIAKLGSEPGSQSRPSCGQEEGKKVHHPIFGDGAVVTVNEDEGTAVVRFEGFGMRNVRQNILT